MCGICGALTLSPSDAPPCAPDTLAAMSAALRHRGPDSQGWFADPDIALAVRRLAIMDPEGSDQPIASEDGQVQVVFNGESYNHRELRHHLRRRGHRFRTGGDTEVLVHLYEERGPRFLAQLGRRRGMSPDELARRLVAPRSSKLSERTYAIVRSQAKRIVTQGHMAQHFLFHALHQTAIPSRAHQIFGVHDRQQFLELRRAEISPLGIGELHGRTRVQMRRAAAQALRDAATRGVNKGLMTPLQRRITLERQLRQLPRWLGQSRYNGPTAGVNRPDLPPGDTAKHPTITADGSRAVWDAYRATISEAERRGEIHVQTAALSGGAPAAVSPAVRAQASPRGGCAPRSGCTIA